MTRDGSVMVVVGSVSSRGIFKKSVDGGVTWSNYAYATPSSASVRTFRGAAISDDGQTIAAVCTGTQDAQTDVWVTRDGGEASELPLTDRWGEMDGWPCPCLFYYHRLPAPACLLAGNTWNNYNITTTLSSSAWTIAMSGRFNKKGHQQ